jgi:hypothetical protein
MEATSQATDSSHNVARLTAPARERRPVQRDRGRNHSHVAAVAGEPRSVRGASCVVGKRSCRKLCGNPRQCSWLREQEIPDQHA